MIYFMYYMDIHISFVLYEYSYDIVYVFYEIEKSTYKQFHWNIHSFHYCTYVHRYFWLVWFSSVSSHCWSRVNKTKRETNLIWLEKIEQMSSHTFLFSWSIMTLCGLTSRCMMPMLWQNSKACNSCKQFQPVPAQQQSRIRAWYISRSLDEQCKRKITIMQNQYERVQTN